MIPSGGFGTTLKERRGTRRSDSVRTNDRHVALIEPIRQVRRVLWRQLDRNDARVGSDKRASYRFSSRTDVENKVTRNDASVCDDAARPTTIELMPPPP